jgi:hypothetical protein
MKDMSMSKAIDFDDVWGDGHIPITCLLCAVVFVLLDLLR